MERSVIVSVEEQDTRIGADSRITYLLELVENNEVVLTVREIRFNGLPVLLSVLLGGQVQILL